MPFKSLLYIFPFLYSQRCQAMRDHYQFPIYKMEESEDDDEPEEDDDFDEDWEDEEED